MIPDKYNELIGLQHCKLFVFDDSVIISGANLSTDYFTNRQDRYILIGNYYVILYYLYSPLYKCHPSFFSENCEALATFCESFIRKISEFSLELQSDGSFLVPHSWDGGHPFEGNYQKFVEAARRSLTEWLASYQATNRVTFNGAKSVFQSSTSTSSSSSTSKLLAKQNSLLSSQSHSSLNNEAVEDTWIFPSIQMGSFDVNHDSALTTRFLQSGAPGAIFKFATGVFNHSIILLISIFKKVFKKLFSRIRAWSEKVNPISFVGVSL